MIRKRLYEHLYEFVHAFGPIFNSLPINLKTFKLFNSFIPIKFEGNIIISDLNLKFYFRISLEDYYIRKKNFDFCDLTLIANSKTWIKIFSGKVTLMGEYNLGNIMMTSVRREYVLRIAILSGIFFNFATKKKRLIRTGKYFKFPLFSRRIFTPLFKILFKILKFIPDVAFERFMRRISTFLEEE
ncbi:MAG: hypothetical protein ACTSQJ_04370 [Promethearchaeota archaeon]